MPPKNVKKTKTTINFPNDLLAIAEDLAHQMYTSRNEFVVMAVKEGAKIIAEKFELEFDRPNKVTYK